MRRPRARKKDEMNNCVICTFLKMVWNGLWDKSCPSIDKTKKEKPLGFWKGLREFLLSLAVAVPITFIVYWIYQLLVWILGVYILTIIFLIIFSPFFVLAVVAIIFGLVEFTKIRIACIKAYWRKAKEECE